MAQPELGTKRICGDCDAKFYDLNRSPAACPKCGYTVTAKKASSTPVAKPAKPAKEVEEPAKAAAVESDEIDAGQETLDDSALLAAEIEEVDADEELDEPAVKDTLIDSDEDDDENVADLIEGVSTNTEEN